MPNNQNESGRPDSLGPSVAPTPDAGADARDALLWEARDALNSAIELLEAEDYKTKNLDCVVDKLNAALGQQAGGPATTTTEKIL